MITVCQLRHFTVIEPATLHHDAVYKTSYFLYNILYSRRTVFDAVAYRRSFEACYIGSWVGLVTCNFFTLIQGCQVVPENVTTQLE